MEWAKTALPRPSPPSRHSRGTRQPRKATRPAGQLSSPIFASGSPTSTPGVPAGTANAEVPRKPAPGLVVA